MESLVTGSANPEREFWRGKRVVLTGHSGFKGSWLTLWLRRLGAEVTGISLPPATNPSLFELASVHDLADSHFCDIRDAHAVAALVERSRPEVLFHLAAQPLVRASYREPLTTFSSNVQGTANVLEALRSLESIRVVVAVTTDKVYKNVEQPFPYRETDSLGGHDPYSASKAAAEIVVASYRDSFLALKNVAVASARAGNVIGGGDWSEDRLLPDAVRAWSGGDPLHVRRPGAVRPWQHVLEPLAGYLILAEHLWRQPSLAGAFNFGPNSHEAATVREVVEQAQNIYGAGRVLWGDAAAGEHEAGWLTLEIAKARSQLGFAPRWPLGEAVRRTIEWYRLQRDGADARGLCVADIDAYEAARDTWSGAS